MSEPDWAEQKAREWTCQWESPIDLDEDEQGDFQQSLSALLREVGKQGATNATPLDGWVPLAEVRRVVVDEMQKWESHSIAAFALREILSRLDKL